MAPSVANEVNTYALIICVLPRCARGEVIKYDMNMMNLLFFVSNLCPAVHVLSKNMLHFLYAIAAGFLVRQRKVTVSTEKRAHCGYLMWKCGWCSGNLLKDPSCVRYTGTTSKSD